MDLSVGLLINFGDVRLKDSLHRIVNKLPPSAPPREPERAARMSTIGQPERAIQTGSCPFAGTA